MWPKNLLLIITLLIGACSVVQVSGESVSKKDFQKKIARLKPQEQPPKDYVAKNACPFECCQFGEWKVLKETILYEKPNGKKRIGKVKDGMAVALTGEVHLKPNPIGVVFDTPPFKVGDILFLLDPTGEGYVNYWHKGKIENTEIMPAERCEPPSQECWVEYVYPEKDKRRSGKGIWWVKIQQGKKTGWTKETQNFSGQDSCG